MRPTFRNLNESFEGWAYRSGLSRRIADLEKERYLERRNRTDRICKLTAKGRERALGGRDPKVQWERPWDGWWRLVCFDVPMARNRQRNQLRYYLRSKWFGLLQRSIWISPDPVQEEARRMRRATVEAKSLVLLEARTCGGESDAHVVASAWNFQLINKLYGDHLKILEKPAVAKVTTKNQAKVLLRWTQAEHRAWTDAIRADPLLPKVLLPDDYLGRRAWERRVQVMELAGAAVKRFVA